jgi:hypothetical protein
MVRRLAAPAGLSGRENYWRARTSEIAIVTGFSDQSHYTRLLRACRQRPRHSGAADKCNKFPSPHGFARAKDYIGYEQNITFWIDGS